MVNLQDGTLQEGDIVQDWTYVFLARYLQGM